MAPDIITAPELQDRDDGYIRENLTKWIPKFNQRMDHAAGDLIGDLERIIKYSLWQRAGFESLEDYAKQCLNHSERWCHEAIRLYRQEWSAQQRRNGTIGQLNKDVAAIVRNAPAEVGPGQGKRTDLDKGLRDNITKLQRGTQATYLAARLKRDRPDLAAKVVSGEIKSIRAAAIEAGIVKVPSALVLLKRAWKKASHGEREEFKQWIAKS
jgi:hypothetical protein